MQAIILTAGESSRFWPLNQKHKTLTKIMGRPLISYTIEGARKNGIKDFVIVQGPKREIEEELRGIPGIQFVVQPSPKGTGDAIIKAQKFLKKDQPFVVLNAEQINSGDYLKSLLRGIKNTKAKLLAIAGETRTPWLFGIATVKRKRLMEIVEKPLKGKESSNLSMVGNIYFLPADFLGYLKKIGQRPFALPMAVSLYAKKNLVEIVKVENQNLFLKYPWHLFACRDYLFGKFLKPEIAKSAKIAKNVIINGRVYIGKDVKISENTIINGPCFIGDRCDIRENNVLQGPLDLEDEIIIRPFSEIKNCVIGSRTHIHRGYIGDSIIGEDCRFGVGFVSANRRIDRKNIFSTVKGEKTDTGLTRFGAVVGKNSKFGIQVGVMPGVFVGSNCVVWPGTTVFKNIPDGSVEKNENHKS